jgi:hypothetical protein
MRKWFVKENERKCVGGLIKKMRKWFEFFKENERKCVSASFEKA